MRGEGACDVRVCVRGKGVRVCEVRVLCKR